MGKKNTVRVVQSGQPFAIDLEAIPGAGYMWEMRSLPDELELVSQEVVSISEGIGGSATQRFLLVAHRTGNYSLEFGLKRRWEKDPARINVFHIAVK